MFTKWGLSYVLISVVAIAVIVCCSGLYSRALREDLEHTNAVQMEIMQLQMDRAVRNLRTFTNRANMNSTVRKLRQTDSYETISPYTLYGLVRDLGNEMVFDNDNQECYLYFPASDFLISGRYYSNSKNFYDVMLQSMGFSYEDLYDWLNQEYRTTQIFSIPVKNGKFRTVFLKPLDISNRQVPSAYALMIMDLDEVLRTSAWLNQERDIICIIDRVNNRIVSSAGLDPDLEEALLSPGGDGSVDRTFETQQESEHFAVSLYPSQYENWDYVVITQGQGIAAKASELSYLMGIAALSYLGISVIVMAFAVFSRYRSVKKVIDLLKGENDDEERQTSLDAYEYIHRSVHRLMDKNKENSSVISRQKDAIGRALFHRLLTESNACQVLDQEILIQYGMKAGDSCCCVFSCRMEKDTGSLQTEADPDMWEISWFILRNVAEENLVYHGLDCVSFQESDTEQVFLIWAKEGMPREEMGNVCRQALSESAGFIREHFNLSYQMALSEIHNGINEIYRAYQEVQMVFEYQKKEERQGVVCYGEINLLPKDTLLRYPVDVENRLVHSVRKGDAEDACREIREILKENQVNCLAPEAMQFLVSNIAASIVRAVGRISQETELSISQKALMEACRQENREKMQEELERLAVTACQEVMEFDRKEKENQKEKLYQDVRKFVEEHYDDAELSVNYMAEHFGVQAAYLSRLFKDMEGIKLSEYIHRVRLTHVKKMLIAGERLENIAIRCGFGSQRTFLRIFKHYEGITPTQFKEMEEKKRREEEKK